jgi:hypothetical protein
VAPREYIAEEKKAVLTQRNKPQGENAANFVPKPNQRSKNAPKKLGFLDESNPPLLTHQIDNTDSNKRTCT